MPEKTPEGYTLCAIKDGRRWDPEAVLWALLGVALALAALAPGTSRRTASASYGTVAF
jgi:hypothetical protein